MVDLSLAKLHLNISHDSDDTLIQGYINAAISYVNKECGLIIKDLDPLPPALDQAVLLLIGGFYENREATISAKFIENRAVETILSQYRTAYL
jgi:uncharacterized phage protein (predicted DNA packaging)